MEKSDIKSIVDYFIDADPDFLMSLGVDKSKLPKKIQWIKKLNKEFEKPIEKKEFYYIIWLIDNKPVGHSNINKIDFGQTATMHLHLWKDQKRKKGLGPEFLKLTIPFYFKNFELEKLICEPYAQNIAPNKVLKKTGFEFIKEYETIPGWINFHQSVCRYEMSKERFEIVKNGTHKAYKNPAGPI